MKTSKLFVVVLVLFVVGADGLAQTSRRRGTRRPAGVTPAAASQPPSQPEGPPTPATPTAPVAPIPLAILNGQTITTADINPQVRPEVEALDGRIAVARQQVLDIQINTVLLESEAAKRRISPQQLYELEVVRKIGQPTAAEIDKFIQANRDRVAQADPATIRQQVASYIQSEREATTTDEFIKRLRVTYPVVGVAPANAVTLPASAVVITVGGRPITAGVVDGSSRSFSNCGSTRINLRGKQWK
jgi:hypothetical protein